MIGYKASQINNTKAVRFSGLLCQTLKRFNIIDSKWAGAFKEENYLFKVAVREIRDAEDKEFVVTTINGVDASNFSSYR